MAFQIQRINDAARSSEIHQRVLAMRNGLPLGERLVDESRSAYFYALSISADTDRPPGEYVLFIAGCAVRVRAYEQGHREAGAGRVLCFRIHSIEIPTELEPTRDSIDALLAEAFKVRAKNDIVPAVRVEVTHAK